VPEAESVIELITILVDDTVNVPVEDNDAEDGRSEKRGLLG
jgi:hypothetical protein